MIRISDPARLSHSIHLERSLLLSGRRWDYVDEPLSIAQLSDGRYILVTMTNPQRLAVFGSNGFLVHVIGREGEGPGEFRALRFVWTARGDTIEAFDTFLRRLTRFTPDYRLVDIRQVDIFGGFDVLAMDRGLVTAQHVPTVERAGFPIHLLDKFGKILDSFGSEVPEYRNNQHLIWRSLAGNKHRSELWAAHLTEYRIEQWSLAGHKMKEYSRDVLWFRASIRAGPDLNRMDQPPKPALIDLRLDEHERLWVVIHVADKEWQQGVGKVRDFYGRTVRGPSDPRRYYDTIVEVIDTKRNVLIARGRFDAPMRFVGETSGMYEYSTDDEGFPLVQLWRVTLQP